jgi:hypothetical protein
MDRSEPENALAVGPRRGRNLLSWRANSLTRQQACPRRWSCTALRLGKNTVEQRPPYGSPKTHGCPMTSSGFRISGRETCGPHRSTNYAEGGDLCGLRSTRRWARVHEDSVGRGADREPVDPRDRSEKVIGRTRDRLRPTQGTSHRARQSRSAASQPPADVVPTDLIASHRYIGRWRTPHVATMLPSPHA